MLSGIPRSGTSLCCRLAGKLPDFVALSEPIGRDASTTADDATAAVALIERFVAEARARALAEGRAPTVHVDGRLDDNRAARALSKDGLRRLPGERGDVQIDGPLSSAFTLLVKHNALFAALLPGLTAAFPCLAVVRNPLAVLASWQTVDLPVARGRLPAGEQFDAGLRAALDGEPDVLQRQIVILNWFFAQYLAHLPPQRIVRYEPLIADGGMALYRALGQASVPTEALVNRNDNALYENADVDRLQATLLETGGAWTRCYTASDCAVVAAAIRRRNDDP